MRGARRGNRRLPKAGAFHTARKSRIERALERYGRLGIIGGVAVTWWVICPLAARAQVPCRLEGPFPSSYRLTSDIIEWRLTIGPGQSCVRGLRYAAVTIDDIQLVTAPQSGHVTFEGTAFLYQAAPHFRGMDAFSLSVSGKRHFDFVSGSSTIRVMVFSTR